MRSESAWFTRQPKVTIEYFSRTVSVGLLVAQPFARRACSTFSASFFL